MARRTLVILVLFAGLVLAFGNPAWASVINFGHWNSGGNWDAVADGGAFNGGSFFNGDPHGGSGHGGNQWGQYQGRGWFAGGWQRVDGGPQDGSYLWTDNFNLYDAIFGDPQNYQQLNVGDYQLAGGYQIGVNLYDSLPRSWGRITDGEHNTSTGGTLTLTNIVFGDDSDGIGRITLVGKITGDLAGALGSDSLDFVWSLRDHDSSPNHTLLSGLNSGNNHPSRLHLRGEGGSLTGNAQATPEPASVALLASALGASAFIGWRRRRRSQPA